MVMHRVIHTLCTISWRSRSDCLHRPRSAVCAIEHVDQGVLDRELLGGRRQDGARNLLDARRVPAVSLLADAQVVAEIPEEGGQAPTLERLLLDDVMPLNRAVANAL